MKALDRRLKKGWLWCLLGGSLLMALLILGGELTGKAKVMETPVAELNLKEIQLLKEYHGARAVKFENGKWYFLGPRGRKWYPLTTPMACRELRLSCTETVAK